MTNEQRERLRQIGRQAFIREEMTRLGFWPPDVQTAAQSAAAEAELKVLYDEMARLSTDLGAVETEIAESGDVPKLLAEVRRRRIERVRAERAVKKGEREQARAEKQNADQARRKTTLPFLGRGVSGGLVYQGGDVARVAELGLPALESASEVARAIGITENELAWLTYHRTAASLDHYHRFAIPKKRGGVRVISSPKSRLRVAQGWLLQSVLARLPVHPAAMAFVPGRSITGNAARHAGQAVVVRVDLENFFPSISVGRVKGLFQWMGYNPGVASLLALVATESPRVAVKLDSEERARFVAVGGRCLPQGACTSPALTNVLCRRLDARLLGAAGALGFRYTRYADDLVFSHDRPDAAVGAVLSVARQILAEERFTINEEKTRVMRPHQRQSVTGLVVNAAEKDGAPRLSRSDLRRFRAFLHQCETRGLDEMTRQQGGRDALAYAQGYVSFIHMVRPDHADKLRAAHPWLAAG